DGVLVKAPATQSFGVDADRTKRIAGANDVGRDILADGAGAAHHGMSTNMHELMHSRQAPQYGPVAHMNMAGQLNGVGNDGVAGNLAVVGNMNISHDPVVIAHPRGADVLHGAGIDGDVLADHVAIANGQGRWLALVLLVLRLAANGTESVKGVVGTNGGVAVKDVVRPDDTPRPDFDVGPDDAVGPHFHVGGQLGAGFNNGGGMDGCTHGYLLFFNGTDFTHQLGFCHNLALYLGDGRIFAHGPADAVGRDLQTQLLTRYHRLPKADLVDAYQIIGRILVGRIDVITPFKGKQGASLRQRLNDEHAGHDRSPGKVPIEERLVVADIFNGHNAFAGHHLDDAVNHQHGITMRQPLQDLLNIKFHNQSCDEGSK